MWAYLPESCRSAPALDPSISPSGLLFLELGRSVWWRGKPSPAGLWRKRWKRESWIRALCGRISLPSTPGLGLGAWISSLQVSRVSLTPSPESGEATKTSEPSAPSWFGSWLSANRRLCSSRMFQTFSSTPGPSGSTFESWVSSGRRPAYRLPRKRAQSTTEPGSFSSLPTPTACSYGTNVGGAAGRVGKVKPSLNTLVRGLPTPTTRDWRCGKASEATHGRNARPLNEVVHRLPTPTTTDAKASGAAGYSTASGRHSGTTLTDAIYRQALLPAASKGRSGKLNPQLCAWMMGLPPELI